MSHNYGLTHIPESMRNGLISLAVCSTVSLLATSSLLISVAYKAIKEYRSPQDHTLSGQSLSRRTLQTRPSFHTQGYFWLLNFFVADFVQSLGLITIYNNLRLDRVMPGPACAIQGFLINSGDIASSIWAFIIAFHTFFLLAGGRKWRAWAAEKSMAGKGRWVVVGAVWSFVVFIGVVGLILIHPIEPEKGPFYDNAGAGWCWISQDYFWERIFFHYFFLFLDMFALSILYCILFFYIRIQLRNFRAAASTSTENVTSQELRTWQVNLESGVPTDPTSPRQIMTQTTVTVMTEERPSTIVSHSQRVRSEADRTHRRMNKVAISLLMYPILYICLTMPLSITRLAQFAGDNWGLPVIHAAAAIYCCSGWVNVLLYTATRRGIISWDWLFRRRKSDPSRGESAVPPSYQSHYPGSGPPPQSSSTLKTGMGSKPSTMSLGSGISPSIQGHQSFKSPDSDSESTYDYSAARFNHVAVSDDDKLVHRPDCVEHGTIRGSNGSTLVGSCNCRAGSSI